MRTAVLWFRRDLRLHDNAALAAALAAADAVVPLYVMPADEPHGPGPSSRAWLTHSLGALDRDLRERGNALVLRAGDVAGSIASAARECGARSVFCQRDWTPPGMAAEQAVRRRLDEDGVALHVSEGQLLIEPGALHAGGGGPYRVFTPFFRAWIRALDRVGPHHAPARIPAPPLLPPTAGPNSPPIGTADVARWWTPGASAARARLAEFVAGALPRYDVERDHPAVSGTSELSAHLAWGGLSPRQVLSSALEAGEEVALPFVRQLAWREFAYHILHAHPSALERPIDHRFERFDWCADADGLAAWRIGRTGFPLVDAGMRQLVATGWMHNRVRLVCASFLTKDLLVPWQFGEEYFRQRLVDYDPALNAFNWQWVAGCGTDASPYFRIFNPTLQGTRFDADGVYVRRWVPELAELPRRWIHRPSESPTDVLETAGVTLGDTYPRQLVDHAHARARALAAYSAIRGD